jgi:hypothetical protein
MMEGRIRGDDAPTSFKKLDKQKAKKVGQEVRLSPR